MLKRRLIPQEIKRIINLRKTGHSLPEIQKMTGKAYGTVYHYIRDVTILPQYQELWRVKRGGSKHKALREKERAKKDVRAMLSHVSKRDKLFILAALYWGEGTKRELNLINGDPELIRVFVSCLGALGVVTNRLKITLRIFEDMDEEEEVSFWARTLHVPRSLIGSVNILNGKKKGRLEHGMCRVRVSKSKDHFKLIMAMIDFIKSEVKAAVV